MERLRTSILLILIVVGILLRLDALIVLYTKRRSVPLSEGIVLSLASPIVAMITFSFADPLIWGRASEKRNWIKLPLEALGLLFCAQIAASWNFLQIVFALDMTIAKDRFFGPSPDQTSFGPETVLLMIVLYAAILVPMLIIHLGRARVRSFFTGGRTVPTSIIGMALIVAVQAIAAFLFSFFNGSDHPVSSSLFERPEGIGEVLVLSLAVVVVAPLIEEIVFRGAIYLAVAERWGRGAGIFASSFLFALAHLDPFSFLPLFAVGYVLGWARSRSGSIVPSYLVHAMNNLAAILLF